MAKPRDLVVRFTSDVRDFLRGTDDVERALEDTARAQEDVAREGDETARKLARAYDRAGDSMKRDMKDASASTKRELGETGREAGQEFTANLGESVAQGDLSSIAQDTAGGLAATFGMAGPVGIAFAALATGAAVKFAQIQADAAKVKQAVSDVFDAIVQQTDKQGRLDAALTREFGSVVEGLTEIQRMSGETGVPVQEITDALVGTAGEADNLAQKFDTIRINAEKGQVAVAGIDVSDAQAAAANLQRIMERTATATGRAADAAVTYRRALQESAQYAAPDSSYRVGGSTYNSQVPAGARNASGRR